VARLCTDYSEAIADGSLLFLLGENAIDPAADFKAYIDLRVREYGQSPYGSKDLASLSNLPGESWEFAKDFLASAPVALTRGYSGGERFVRLITKDFQPGEMLVIHEHPPASLVPTLSLTLRQLLSIRRADSRGRGKAILATDDDLGKLHEAIARSASHSTMSRQILLAAIEERVPRLLDNQYLHARVRERISVLHLRATAGGLSFMEMSHRRDYLSPYYYQHLLTHLTVLADVQHPGSIGARAVLRLRQVPEWERFRESHLAALARVESLKACHDDETGMADLFVESRHKSRFAPVAAILQEEWK
jgi:hypothetical protein